MQITINEDIAVALVGLGGVREALQGESILVEPEGCKLFYDVRGYVLSGYEYAGRDVKRAKARADWTRV